MTERTLNVAAKALADVMIERDLKIVFAESCTGGLVSAALTRIAGVSAHHCGSAVVYRVETKAEWLGISRDTLESPGPVSRVVAQEMAIRVLDHTPEADIAASVTGHLGPNAPAKQDGLVFVGVAVRDRGTKNALPKVVVKRVVLEGATSASARSIRRKRQIAASKLVLEAACAVVVKIKRTS